MANSRTKHHPTGQLRLESLEARDVPAIAVQIDYSLDTLGFFNDPLRRAILQQAADDIGSRIDTPLSTIVPSGGNTWSARFFDPATGQTRSVSNPTIPANTIVLYAGGRPTLGTEAGVGGFGGYQSSGSPEWLQTVESRGGATFAIWGGSISFSTDTNWFFGLTTDGIQPSQVDFYSVAAHELGHVFGIGTAPLWSSQVSGGTFVGPAAESVYGGPVPLSPDSAHWADGLTVNGQPVALDPVLLAGARVQFSSLDLAALRDIGWTVGGVGGPPPPPFTPPVLGNRNPVVLTGPTDGSARVFQLSGDGTLAAAGSPQFPFPGFTGVIRSTVGDFNADGVPDYAFATGPGPAATIRIFDGATGADLVPATGVLGGFTGGTFLAAGDIDRDGAAELAVSADAGGGNRVSLFRISGGTLVPVVDFLAFDDPVFRGGSRVALGDVNHDGAADLIVGAGLGGGPRVSVYDGTALLAGRTGRLIPDFFALDPALRSGVYVSVADVNGDGFADILYSTGFTGGPRVRVVSGAVLVANPGADVAVLPALADFFALDAADRDGIRIATRDLNGDGRAELIVGSGDRTSARVRVIPFEQFSVPTAPLFNPFASPLTIDGVYVG
jgi:hypothetical protein